MMLALYHLYVGKVDPEKLSSQWNFSARPLDVEAGLERFRQALAAGEIEESFERARPQHPWYQRGRERLKEYRALEAAGGWSPISTGPTMQPGVSDPRVPALRYRLTVSKDLEGSLEAPTPPYDLLYDPALEAAVKRFQQRHGLTPDGVIGPGTLQALNVAVSARIDQIRVNL
jgi:murein L,D-transpeptidase YcbB/YkuD